MLVSIVAFLAFVAVFTLLFHAATRRIGQRVGEWVDRRHKAAEVILETGLPPLAWVEPLRSRGEKPARRRLLRELRRLQKYFERSPLVDTEETRQILVEQLEEVRKKWKGAPAADLLKPAARPQPGPP